MSGLLHDFSSNCGGGHDPLLVVFQGRDFDQSPLCVAAMHGFRVVPQSLLREALRVTSGFSAFSPEFVATDVVLGLRASNSGLSLAPSSRPACGVLTLDAFQQRALARATTSWFKRWLFSLFCLSGLSSWPA
jgi:hypothetical protein